jgi:hypothetical protein
MGYGMIAIMIKVCLIATELKFMAAQNSQPLFKCQAMFFYSKLKALVHILLDYY